MIILKKFIGKNVFIQLKSGRFYDGKIITIQPVDSNPDICIIELIDKFGKEIVFYNTEVEVFETKTPKVIQEKEEDW